APGRGRTLHAWAHRDPDSGLMGREDFTKLAAKRAASKDAVALVAIPGLTESGMSEHAHKNMLAAIGEAMRAHSVDGDSATRISENKFGLIEPPGADSSQLRSHVEAIIKSSPFPGPPPQVEVATVRMTGMESTSEGDLAKILLSGLNRFGSANDSVGLTDIAHNIENIMASALSDLSRIRRASANAEFNLVFQPIINLSSGAIAHYEVLSRFSADTTQSPFDLIRFAEETGIISDFDEAVMTKALGWLRGQPLNRDIRPLAINISGASIASDQFNAFLERILQENAWAQGKLMFEITESTKISDLSRANNFIQSLRQAGYPVCLDDFGAGTASFQYLSVMDVDVVKIDGSAIHNAQLTPRGQAFLSALTEFCKRLGVSTIAEMVDSRESLDFCAECGCNYVQGFLFGRPSENLRDFSKWSMTVKQQPETPQLTSQLHIS
ncbi:MAG: EAL domain-containing protein, partial [Magnetospirillum sp.]|nr:EAL domain-containing protein [Magnetospirillum sp.]